MGIKLIFDIGSESCYLSDVRWPDRILAIPGGQRCGREVAIKLDRSVDVKIQEAMGHLEAGNFERAFAILRALESEGCHSPDLLEGMGRACMMTGRIAEAIRYFRTAIQANPNLLTARIILGISLIDYGETTEGVELLKSALICGSSSQGLTPKTRSRLVKDHVRLGDTYVELGMSMEALQEYEKAIRVGGDYPDVRRKIAGQYIRMKLFEDAERELKRALRRNPFYEEARADLGYLYMLRGRTDLAEEEWSRVEPDGRGGGLVWAYLRREGAEEFGDGEPSVDREARFHDEWKNR